LFSLSLATNVIVTSLIAFRIWYVFLISALCDTGVTPFRSLARQLGSHFSDPSFRYRRVLALVVESGAIYSSALVFEIIFYLLSSNVFYIVYDPIAQLTVS